MKTSRQFYFFILLVLFTFSCKKTDITPQQYTPEGKVVDQNSVASCPDYFYYMGNTPQDLGLIFTDKILIGFKKGTNQVNKLMVLSLYPQLDSIVGTTQGTAAELTIVSLKPNLTCLDIANLLASLPTHPHVDFAGGYFDYPFFPGARVGI